MVFQLQMSDQLPQHNGITQTQGLDSAWRPVPGNNLAPDSIKLSGKIKHIDMGGTGARDILERLRQTSFGRFYRSHLRKYYLIRFVTQLIWRVGYPVYIKWISVLLYDRGLKSWRPLLKLNDISKSTDVETYKLLDCENIEVMAPSVFPFSEQQTVLSSQSRYTFPKIFVAAINNAQVYGSTNLILTNNGVICHDLYDFKRDTTSEELHNRVRIHAKKYRIRWLLHDKKPEPIKEAAAFVDACAINYAHWITEVMPRIVLFCRDQRFKDVPIIVNESLHINIMESLLLVVGEDREILLLPVGRALQVEMLYITSVAGYVPFGRRNRNLPGHSHGVFSLQAFEALRERLYDIIPTSNDYSWPDKIFLRRISGLRKVGNIDEIENLLITRGYVIIEPEKLTFLQQVELFRHAKTIIAPTGAALVNAIFCAPGTRVTILMAKHEDMIYRYWNNMLSPLGIKVSYVLGRIIKNRDLGIHADFLVNPDDVIDSLEV